MMNDATIEQAKLSVNRKFRPTDGDMIVTTETLIFQVFGYLHPPCRAVSYLRYVPSRLKALVPLEYEQARWFYKGMEMLRLKTTCLPRYLTALQETFSRHFPYYLYYDNYCGKYLIAVPLERASRVIKPQETLKQLLKAGKHDALQEVTVRLVKLLSRHSGVSISNFGLHGSIALGMHQDFSDIDLTIHGGENYEKVHAAIGSLARQGVVKISEDNQLDALRRNKGVFMGRRFTVNAVRSIEEVEDRYGQLRYTALGHISFTAEVSDHAESYFKPAIYHVANFRNYGESPPQIPKLVASMNSLYRGVFKQGQKIQGEGQLELVEKVNDTCKYTRVVVGSGDPVHSEYLLPLS